MSVHCLQCLCLQINVLFRLDYSPNYCSKTINHLALVKCGETNTPHTMHTHMHTRMHARTHTHTHIDVTGLDIKLVDAVARGASRFENLLAPLKTYWPPPPPKLTGPFLGYISLRYQCIIVIIHRASCISCHSN